MPAGVYFVLARALNGSIPSLPSNEVKVTIGGTTLAPTDLIGIYDITATRTGDSTCTAPSLARPLSLRSRSKRSAAAAAGSG